MLGGVACGDELDYFLLGTLFARCFFPFLFYTVSVLFYVVAKIYELVFLARWKLLQNQGG